MPARTDLARTRIFLSYRRDDTRSASGRLYDWLRIAFGRDCVFRDVHNIGVGNWRASIETALSVSTVCIAVIGPRWTSAENLQRLHDPADMVRHELQTALSQGTTCVPTLVEGAALPHLQDLPPEQRPLLEIWNARHISEDGWETDTGRLIREIAAASGLTAGPDLDTLLRDVHATRDRFLRPKLPSALH